MAKLQWILMSLALLLTVNLAQAKKTVEKKEDGTTVETYSCRGMECLEFADQPYWNEAEFLNAGLKTNHLFAVASSDGLESDSYNSGGLFVSYGWSYGEEGESLMGPTLRFEGYTARGRADGQDVSDNGLLLSPGFFLGQYLGKRWILTETVLLPLSFNGPGLQAEVGVVYTLLNWLAIELSLAAGYLQTALPVRGEDENMLGIGPSLGIIFEPWGDYRVE